MKVVMFSRFPSDIDHPRGGVETATIGLARGLVASSEIELHIVTLEKGRTEVSIEIQEGITIHRLPDNHIPMFIDILIGPGKKKLREYILSLKPDVVHFQETYGLGMGDMGIPSVFTVHGFDSLNLVTEKRRLWWLRSLIWKQVEKAGLKKQKHIISIIPYVRKEIEKHTDATIHDIENAISIDYFNYKSAQIAGRIFFAGWLNPRKNVICLLKAIPYIIEKEKNISVHIAGEASDSNYYHMIKATINDLGISDHVTLLGRVDQEKIKQELAEATVFVLPSKQENAPMAIAEAMAMGVPPISTNVCGMPYMITEGETGFLVEPDNPAELAKRILLMVQDIDCHKRISLSAIKEARDKYHPDSVARRTIQLYKQLVNEYGVLR